MQNPAPPRAVVTGASAGIGVAYAEQLARRGYDLVLVARRNERLEALAERLRRETGRAAEPVGADLTDPRTLLALEERLAQDERLALLVNNAGFGGYRPFVELDPAVADSLVDLHIRAVVRLTRAALPGMVRRDAGGIINVASLLALSGTMPPNPLPHRAVYAGAKAFIVTFTEALAGELHESQVRVQVCLPGLVDTEFHDVVGRDRSKMPPMMAAPDLVAASLAALDRGEMTCIPGLDDPALLDRLAETQRAIIGRGATAQMPAARYRGQAGD